VDNQPVFCLKALIMNQKSLRMHMVEMGCLFILAVDMLKNHTAYRFKNPVWFFSMVWNKKGIPFSMPMHSQALLNPGKAFEQNIQAACPNPCKPYL
jgi:hypothetical protein